MKRNLLFMILCITTLTFIGCGKKETPIMSNNVDTKEEIEVENMTTDETIAEEIKEVEETTENITEEVENKQEIINESTLLEEEQNEETGSLEEVKETMENDPDAADPSLTPEELEMIENMFSGEGSFGGEEIQYSTDHNDGVGLEYHGGTEPW
mgnify:CR=1 FL=1